MRILSVGEQITTEIKKIESARKNEATAKTKAPRVDRSDISAGAQRLSATQAESEIVAAQVRNQPEIREDRVEEVKNRISSGYYNSPEFMDKLADKLLSDFGFAGNQLL